MDLNNLGHSALELTAGSIQCDSSNMAQEQHPTARTLAHSKGPAFSERTAMANDLRGWGGARFSEGAEVRQLLEIQRFFILLWTS